MQIVKSITAKEFFEKFPQVRKQLWGGEFWGDGGYIGTEGGVMANVKRNYVETQGTPEEKEGYTQMNLLDFSDYNDADMPLACCGVRRRSFTLG
jgi:putative transposase